MVLPGANRTKSFWIEAADSPLRNFGSSEPLPELTDVAIIGSGYAGTTTAYWIHKFTQGRSKQPRVTILEAQDICGSATGRNGGQLRPHAYSRYVIWRDRFGPHGAMELIKHEMAHLSAFKHLAEHEGITEEVCLKFGDTFDAAMTDEAWARLKSALQAMQDDHGVDDDVVKVCRIIDDAAQAEEFTQMKGALAAVVHPAGQIWPYKFVHALLRILLRAGNLSLHANTAVIGISERNTQGFIHVKTARGIIRARAVVHTTNRWASHLLPEFEKLILPVRTSVNAIKAPPGFIKHTGSQHYDSIVNNYHLQLPAPYNAIIFGGARPITVHTPDAQFMNDEDDKQFVGVPDFCRAWPASNIKDWPGPSIAELGLPADKGGCWTGIESASADDFPFVGPVPDRENHFINAGFAGHGMPRILLSAAHITPLVLDSIGVEYSQPCLAASYPVLPRSFLATPERVAQLQDTDPESILQDYRERSEESAKKSFCDPGRIYKPMTP